MSIARTIGFALVFAIVASNQCALAATPADDRSASYSDAKLNRIATDCATSNARCLAHFDRYERSAKEHAQTGGFNLFGVFKGSGLTFWGAVEELTYTEVEYPLHKDGPMIEYQIGFGYILYAKQRDAKLAADGIVGSLTASANGDIGRSRYWAAIIGLAQGQATDCADKAVKGELKALLCSLDMQPTINQAYFASAAGKLAANYDEWRQSVTGQGSAALSAICPQVINYRYADRPKETPKAESVATTVIAINAILRAACSNPRPNAIITYKDGDPANPNRSASAGLGEEDATHKDGALSQGYYRDGIFLAATKKRVASYYLDGDQYAELIVSGVVDSASLPSILASIVSYKRTDKTKQLRVRMHCSDGAGSVSVADDPVSNPIAFAKLMLNIRIAVDKPKGLCA